MTTGEDPSSCGARLARLGHSDSIITCAPLIESSACAIRPSGPGRTFNSEAPNVALQNSISAAASRHTSIAITGEIPAGRDLFISVLRLTIAMMSGFRLTGKPGQQLSPLVDNEKRG